MNGRANPRLPPATNGRPTWADVETCLDAGLRRTKSEKGKAALTCVHAAVQALREVGGSITFQAVGAWCTAHRGGPTAQSVQNNERTADIVRIASAVQVVDARPRIGRPIELRLLEQIGDLELRAELEALLAHRRALIAEANGLRSAIRRIEALSFLTKEMAEAGLDTLEELARGIAGTRRAGGPVFSIEEGAACRAFLDAGLAACRMSIDEPSGEIIDHVMRTVAERGVVSALRTVSGHVPA